METVKLVPTWKAATRIFTEVLMHGNKEGHQNAVEGLFECAEAADKHNKLVEKLPTIQADAVINFAYFTANFPSDFIEKCWGDGWMKDHLREKFENTSENNFYSMGDFMRFFMDLDDENRKILIKWINKNYKAFDYLNV